MAVATGLVAVRTDRGNVEPLRLLVTAHARRGTHSEISAEAVTILTCRRLRHPERIRLVQGRLHRAVTPLAQVRRGHGEAEVPVAIATRHVRLTDVDRVAGAGPHVLPGRGDVLRWRVLASAVAVAGREHERDREQADAADREGAAPHRAPIGWHIRHGIAVSGCRLDQPGGCGLPPTPPTA
jgi:hypothetical protein